MSTLSIPVVSNLVNSIPQVVLKGQTTLNARGGYLGSAGKGTLFHLHESQVELQNTKIEKSIPRRVSFLENLGKKSEILRKYWNFSPIQGHFFRKNQSHIGSILWTSAEGLNVGIDFNKITNG